MNMYYGKPLGFQIKIKIYNFDIFVFMGYIHTEEGIPQSLCTTNASNNVLTNISTYSFASSNSK